MFSHMFSGGQVKQLVNEAKKNRKNRVYYEKCFNVADLYDGGFIQNEEKSLYDQVALVESKNDSIHLFGVDQNGSYFDLSVSTFSLYPNVQRPTVESKWRLTNVNFVYVNSETNCKYSYDYEQLIDYEEKRRHPDVNKNVYKIGSISIETVLPFSFSRILFNGMLNRNQNGIEDLISTKITISTHPTCDKFDYKYKFDVNYLTSKIQESIELSHVINQDENQKKAISRDAAKDIPKKLLDLVLEDRIDQPLMFQGELEFWFSPTAITSELANNKRTEQFIMWGAKVKRFIDPREELAKELNEEGGDNADKKQENLFIWTECGQQVHLSRSLKYPNLVYGMMHSSFDYASYFYGAKLFQKKADNEQEIEINFDQVQSFSKLAHDVRIVLTGFEKKEFSIELCANVNLFEGTINEKQHTNHNKPFSATINQFKGWCFSGHCDTLGKRLRLAQSHLWALNINDKKLSFRLASESLLGGKGNSLIYLNKLVQSNVFTCCNMFGNNVLDRQRKAVSVPRGLVVSCVMYKIWLNSYPKILDSINELDRIRRTLAAKSVYQNPLSDKHLTLAQNQQILKEQCQKTRLVLNSCPLPLLLRDHLRTALEKVFTKDELIDHENSKKNNGILQQNDTNEGKLLFAVRSSAVGEDSLETSAAGQLKTILGVGGFETICEAIVECWSSQFDHEAVIYKNQNGLAFNLPMAVVVQELIQCRAAGVAATCDPLTGNKEQLEILANFGLGEGVVSGKQTDTIRISLKSLDWDIKCEEPIGYLSLNNAHEYICKLPGSTIKPDDSEIEAEIDKIECCLDNEQIIALANLLIKLRQLNEIKEREIEWGITLTTSQPDPMPSSSSTSSSSSSATSSSAMSHQCSNISNGLAEPSFRVHLLQSRPLTNLSRLCSRETDHELDFGFCSPLDVISRANLGEVMPGVLCPLTISYFLSMSTTIKREKPFEHNHTYKPFTANAFAFYAQMATMILTYSDTIHAFKVANNGEMNDEYEIVMQMMIGTATNSIDDSAKHKLFKIEKNNPLEKRDKSKFVEILALDSGLMEFLYSKNKNQANKTMLEDDLTSLEELFESLEQQIDHHNHQAANNQVSKNIKTDISKLYNRLCKKIQPITNAWVHHVRSTLLSMAFNIMCMKLLSSQPAYSSNLDSSELLNDFSILMRGGKTTESADILMLLNKLIDTLKSEGLFNRAKNMTNKELYEYLSTSESKCASLYRKFIENNGHRTYKEFDFSSLTWADDPSYIIKSLAARLKQFKNKIDDEVRDEKNETKLEEQEEKVKTILKKVERGKSFLSGYALPRARNAVVRRERSKSWLIKMIDKYRQAFRHLGALLCLEGKLPSADLIYQLCIEELDIVVKADSDEQRANLSRILYKARRRQQRARLLNKIKFPQPTIDFSEMVKTVKRVSEGETDSATNLQQCPIKNGKKSGSNNSINYYGRENVVRGLTSCAGYVTGRACVVNNLEDIDQIEPNDILITYSIDISWSVYFFTLAGIVTEMGGIVSHGAVVAREYGIPTLCTAVNACSMFKTGQIVTLNANDGIIYLSDDTIGNDKSDGSIIK